MVIRNQYYYKIYIINKTSNELNVVFFYLITIKMKLLIGGKNRNIHFRKDNSAFYKSNGQENDVTHLFKKTGGGLKKQYEEYLVSENDLTERYKALNISGGGSKSPKKKVDKSDKGSKADKSSKAVRDKPINKKKNRGKKFLGGMTITGISIDIGGPDGSLGEKFNIYIKLLGAYYLALLSDLEPSLFIKNDPDVVKTANNTRKFHRNKLNNLLLMDFMEKDQGGGGRYLPYPRDNKLQNLVFCHTLLNSVKNYKTDLKEDVAVANPNLITAVEITNLNTANTLPDANLPTIINILFHQALEVCNALNHPLVAGGPGVQQPPLAPVVRDIAAVAAVAAVALAPADIPQNLVLFAGNALYTAAGGANPVPAPAPAGPDIVAHMRDYKLPNYAIPADCELIKAQLYRVIIADKLYEDQLVAAVPGPGAQAHQAVTNHPLSQVLYADIAATSLNLPDPALIISFEGLYIAANRNVVNVIRPAVEADVRAAYATVVGVDANANPDAPLGAGPSAANVNLPANIFINTANNNSAADEFKEIPYIIFSDYINGYMNPARPVQPPPPALQGGIISVKEAIQYYLRNTVYPAVNILREAIIITNPPGVPVPTVTTGLFAPNIPDVE
jgi:hypothetical protein